MVAVKAKGLAGGLLATASGVIYRPNVDTYADATVTLVNTSSSTVKVNLNLSVDGGAQRRLIPKDGRLKASESLEVAVSVGPDDLLYGDASLADVVSYSIDGATLK